MLTESLSLFWTETGTLAGKFDADTYTFKNAQFSEIIDDFNRFQKVLKKIRNNKPFKILLTVSPVPLTATASGNHVLVSTIQSKSILRAVAGELSTNQSNIDYFPSFEIVTNPRLHSSSFSDNLRSVRDETVEIVMRHFFGEHHAINEKSADQESTKQVSKSPVEDIQCEEALMEAFAK